MCISNLGVAFRRRWQEGVPIQLLQSSELEAHGDQAPGTAIQLHGVGGQHLDLVGPSAMVMPPGPAAMGAGPLLSWGAPAVSGRDSLREHATRTRAQRIAAVRLVRVGIVIIGRLLGAYIFGSLGAMNGNR